MSCFGKPQSNIIKQFYSIEKTKVIFNKKERNSLWEQVSHFNNPLGNFKYIESKCPALYDEIKSAYEHGHNIRSAVFSECVYSQTLANMLNLNHFCNCVEEPNFIKVYGKILSELHNLSPRYAYLNEDKSSMLIQAGAPGGVDAALVDIAHSNVETIEFKEALAKTHEADLPKYGENGKLLITEEFNKNYPQFKRMLKEHKRLNFFDSMGHNINKFSTRSVNYAVNHSYLNTDVICTEDNEGYLIMLSPNQMASLFDAIGEIRTAGRNHYNVWTPIALTNFIKQKGGIIENNKVKIKKDQLELRRERGRTEKISGYKINSLFFVYSEDCLADEDFIWFNLDKVQQLRPTIAVKISLAKLKNYDDVKRYYQNYKDKRWQKLR